MAASLSTDKTASLNPYKNGPEDRLFRYKFIDTTTIAVVGAVLLLVLLFSAVMFIAYSSEMRMLDACTLLPSTTKEADTKPPPPERHTKMVCAYHLKEITSATRLASTTASCDKIVIFVLKFKDIQQIGVGAFFVLRFLKKDTYLSIDWSEASRLDRDEVRKTWKDSVNKELRYSLAFVPPGKLSSPKVKDFVEALQRKQPNGDLGLALGVLFSDPILATEQQTVVSSLGEISGRFDFIMMDLKSTDSRDRPCQVFPRWKSEAVLGLYNWAKKSLAAPAPAMATAAIYEVDESHGGDCVTDRNVGESAKLDCDERTEEPVFTTTDNKTYATETRRTLAEMRKAYRKADVRMIFIDHLEHLDVPNKCVTRNLSDYSP